VSVAIEADKAVFQLYHGGIISSTSCGTRLDHGVLVVGYGTDKGSDYWLLKNSWGPTWGEKGYFRIARDSARGPGICGL
jgi:C1A family cysteine protease